MAIAVFPIFHTKKMNREKSIAACVFKNINTFLLFPAFEQKNMFGIIDYFVFR